MKTALIVAFHFPPFGAGSGILRILKFCRFLPEFEWQPVILTANVRAYERLDPTLVGEIPSDVPVFRAFALDTQRHLSAKGRYLRWMADLHGAIYNSNVPEAVSLAFCRKVPADSERL